MICLLHAEFALNEVYIRQAFKDAAASFLDENDNSDSTNKNIYKVISLAGYPPENHEVWEWLPELP